MQVCRDATAAAPCYPGTFTGDCKTYNKSNCGLQFSDQQNAAYCAIDTPSTWPPLLQVCMRRSPAAGWPQLTPCADRSMLHGARHTDLTWMVVHTKT